jgi:hypothetical protein
MLVTLAGIVTLVRPLSKNAFSPIAVTGAPPMLAGMITNPPVPV